MAAAGTTVPASRISGAVYIPDFDTNNQNVIWIGGADSAKTAATPNTGTALSALPLSILDKDTAYSLDSKVDDGVGTTGQVVAYVGSTATASGAVGVTPTGYTQGNIYALTFVLGV